MKLNDFFGSSHISMHTLHILMDWNFCFYGWYSPIYNDFECQLSNGRNIEKNIRKIVRFVQISVIYRFGTDKLAIKSEHGRMDKNCLKITEFLTLFGLFLKISDFLGFFKKNFENSHIWIFYEVQISPLFLYCHFILYYPFIFNTFHIYLINPIFKNYYHFTIIIIYIYIYIYIYLSFQFYLILNVFILKY